MIAVALPSVIGEFNVSVTRAAWLVTAYLVAMASLQPLAGKLGDRFGRRGLMLAGLSLFGLASLGAATSPNLYVLIAFRVLQAATGALVLPNAVALVREVMPEERRARGFGLIGASVGLAAAAGPPIGGLLVDAAGWRAIFYINVPIVALALYMGWRWIPSPQRSDVRRAAFDVPGAILLPAVLASLAAFVMLIAGGGLSASAAIAGGVAVAVAAAVFAWREYRHQDPVFQPRLFTVRSFAASNAGVAFSNMAMYSLLLSVPLLLSSRGSYSNIQVGLVLMALSVAMVFFTPLGGWLADRFGRRIPTAAGLSLLALAALPLALEGDGVALAVLVPSLAAVGVGLGVANPGLQTSAVESVKRGQAGAAAGVYSTSRYFGSIVGSAILAGLIGADRTYAAGIGPVFVLVFAAAAVSAFAALWLKARPDAAISR